MSNNKTGKPVNDPLPPRRYSYSPVTLVTDVIAVLRMHGVIVELSAAEKIRKPTEAARKLLKALHVSPKSSHVPANWWLKGTWTDPRLLDPVISVLPRRPANPAA